MANKGIVILLGMAIVLGAIYGLTMWDVDQKSSRQSGSDQAFDADQPTQSQQEANIKLTLPTANSTLTLPFVISGEARVFENQLRYRLLECDGKVLDEGYLTANAADMGLYGPFNVQVTSIPNISSKNGCIEVFSNSPKDGSEINVVTLPITFDLTDTLVVKAFFGSKESPEGEECTTVYPVERRVVKTQSVARAALEELLKGPQVIERDKGYYTNINEGVAIQKITVDNGVARVDFSTRLDEGVAGSCKVTAIRTQIISTLKQFPTVKNVIISINGRTEDILQP